MDSFLKNLGGVTLKSLLENPSLLQPPPAACRTQQNVSEDGATMGMATDTTTRSSTEESDYDKKLKDVEGDYFASSDFGAAFLGPNLWDKTYGDDDFKLEYMELDEFLLENGLPQMASDPVLAKEQTSAEESSNNARDSCSPPALHVTTEEQPVSPVSTASVEREMSPLPVNVNFDLSPTDVALATAPGQNIYDPRTRTFSEEELKPQPMIKKSRKIYVPQEAKDDKYWDRRRKNNVAAKRSRDARRIKENQISMRAAFLEKESNAFRSELIALKKENSSLKSLVKTYEHKLGIQ